MEFLNLAVIIGLIPAPIARSKELSQEASAERPGVGPSTFSKAIGPVLGTLQLATP